MRSYNHVVCRLKRRHIKQSHLNRLNDSFALSRESIMSYTSSASSRHYTSHCLYCRTQRNRNFKIQPWTLLVRKIPWLAKFMPWFFMTWEVVCIVAVDFVGMVCEYDCQTFTTQVSQNSTWVQLSNYGGKVERGTLSAEWPRHFVFFTNKNICDFYSSWLSQSTRSIKLAIYPLVLSSTSEIVPDSYSVRPLIIHCRSGFHSYASIPTCCVMEKPLFPALASCFSDHYTDISGQQCYLHRSWP